MITIRKAKLTDLDRMMEIYARAKRFMDSTGNTTQWEIGYPTRKIIQDDIENGYSFVCMGEDNIPHAAFKFFVGEDPTYRVIEQGSWKNDNTYGTIHRVASDGTIKEYFTDSFLLRSDLPRAFAPIPIRITMSCSICLKRMDLSAVVLYM